jgi:hypothetical protein
MMNKIYKYAVPAEKTFKISMPKFAEILCVQVRGDEEPCIYAEVNPNNQPVDRTFEVFATGMDIPCDMGVYRKYIGTFQVESKTYAFHLYERIN